MTKHLRIGTHKPDVTKTKTRFSAPAFSFRPDRRSDAMPQAATSLLLPPRLPAIIANIPAFPAWRLQCIQPRGASYESAVVYQRCAHGYFLLLDWPRNQTRSACRRTIVVQTGTSAHYRRYRWHDCACTHILLPQPRHRLRPAEQPSPWPPTLHSFSLGVLSMLGKRVPFLLKYSLPPSQ